MQPPSSSNLRVLAFLDLDDTLFRSKRKAQGELGMPVSFTREGQPYGFMAPWQARFFQLLQAMADHVIPTTARTVDAFFRVQLPFHDYAICSLGGVILDGQRSPDLKWAAEVDGILERIQPSPEGLAADLERFSSALQARVVEDRGRAMYLSVRHIHQDPHELRELVRGFSEHLSSDWSYCVYDRDALIRPRALGKANALRWLRTHRLSTPALTLGVGDRFDDREFMACCDYAITPTTSQLFGLIQKPC